MLNKAFHGLSGVFAALGEAHHLPSAASEPVKKPSNLAVRAAIKRKRLAQAAGTAQGPANPRATTGAELK